MSICKNCNNEISNKNYKSIIFCSYSCAATFNNKRRKLSLETKSKISKTIKQRIKEGVFTPITPSQLGKKWAKPTNGEWKNYRRKCFFRFNDKILKHLDGYELYKQYGFYNYKTNRNGVEKDHKYSVYEGWINNIPVDIINHPANCQIIEKKSNSIKGKSSSITIEELYNLINKWNY